MGYLDDNGLIYLWTKIKAHVTSAIKGSIDSSLSSTSTNAVQNKVINSALEGKAASNHTHNYAGSATPGGAAEKAIQDGVGNVIADTYLTNIVSSDDSSPDGETLMLSDANTLNAKTVKIKGATYEPMKGASASTAGAEGLAPAPAAGAQAKYLRGDGTWQTPPNTTYAAMTGASASAAGKTGLVPAPAAGKQAQYLRGDGTWQTPPNTTYADMTGATTSVAGKSGLVPAPSTENSGRFLCGNGKWEKPVAGIEADQSAAAVYLGIWGIGLSTREELKPVSSSLAGIMLPADKIKLDALPTAASLASTYAKKSEIAGMYKYKGSVADASKLPTAGQVIGDVYNIEVASSYGGAGMNVAWDGKKWDPLGEIFTITSITNSSIDTICV